MLYRLRHRALGPLAGLDGRRGRPPALSRLWAYQRERFPLAAHSPLIAAFSLSAITFSAWLRGGRPSAHGALVAFASALVFFLQLRIADEFKDADEDARYRAYRPVPRGLVSLGELAAVGVAGALLQLGLALWLSPALVPLLVLVWGYLALMTREFFAREWLKARPITYMWTHMLIVPLVDFYVTACDWRAAGEPPPAGLPWLLVASLANGFVIELGRKIRAPESEEHGVQTYSALWGGRRATLAWLGVMAAAAAGGTVAASQIHAAVPAVVLLGALLGAACVTGASFLAAPAPRRASWIERMSGAWTLALYLSLGPLPRLLSWLS